MLSRDDKPLAAFLAAAGIGLLVLAWQPESFIYAHFMQDDSFYYLQIAKNIATGYGSTFDRINPTNGYHPLWAFLLVPLFWLVPDNNALAIHLTLTLQVVLTLVSMALFYRLSRLFLDRPAAFFALLLWVNPRLVRLWLDAMPTILSVSIHLALISLVCTRSPLQEPSSRRRDDLAAGVLLGLAFLSRLDAVFLILSVVLTVGFHCLVRKRYSIGHAARRLTFIGIPIAILALPYLFHNLSSFGHIVPISGALKMAHYDLLSVEFAKRAVAQSFWPLRLAAVIFSSLPPSLLIAALLALVCLAGVLWLARSGLQRSFQKLHGLSGMSFYVLFAFLHYFYNSVFIPKSIIYSWYWVPEVLVGLVVAASLFFVLRHWLATRSSFLAALAPSIGYGACALLFVADLALRWDHPRHRFLAEIYKQAMWIKESLPQDAVIAAWDAGALGFISERRVINLDGLVNNFEFQEYKRSGRLEEYLDAKGCQYIAQFFFDNEHDMGKELESIRGRLGERLYRASVALSRRKSHVKTAEGLGHVAIINVWRYKAAEPGADR